MAGNLLLETEQWNEVIENLVKARTIYERMAKLGDPEEQELYRDRVIEIDTSLRFCHFNQNGGTIDDIKTLVDTAHSQQNTTYDLLNAKLENALQETRKRQSTGLDKIQWRGRTVPIKSDKIRSALVSAEDIRTELSNGTKSTSEKLVTYGNLFMAYGDTLEAIRSEQRQLAAKSANQKTAKSETEDGNHTYLIKYISYLKLTKTVERNVILAESLSDSFLTGGGGKRAKPDELVRIYDSLIQNYKELEEIGEAEEVETKKALVAKGLSCRALRCYYLALTYINSYEWSKGLALLNRCLAHAGAAKEHHLDCSNIDKADVAEMDRLVLRIQGEKSLVKAKAYLDTLQAVRTPSCIDPVSPDDRKRSSRPVDRSQTTWMCSPPPLQTPNSLLTSLPSSARPRANQSSSTSPTSSSSSPVSSLLPRRSPSGSSGNQNEHQRAASLLNWPSHPSPPLHDGWCPKKGAFFRAPLARARAG